VETLLAALRSHYGDVALPEPRDPFESIVWENAAYLVDDARRALVFARLRDAVGLEPVALLAAGAKRIEKALHGGGMQPAHRTAKVLRCAEIALEYAGGDVLGTLRALDGRKARNLLKRFPGVADPGADKLLLLAGLSSAPAIDSNGLRVLVRLGAIDEQKTYAATYRLGIAYLNSHGVDTDQKALEAFALLRRHGRELCKRSRPVCGPCPLRPGCPSAS
jgi:endonuclease III